MESNNPMDLLKEEMESDETAVRVNAIHRIRIIATILGPEGVKSTLLPYIDQLIKKEEDEVLFAIASELEQLSHTLPGNQLILLPYLEALASQEETVVREMSVKSLNSIAQNLSDYEIVSNYAPMVLRLANNDTNFTCRVSAVNLMTQIYQRSGQHKDKIRQKFTELCSEETPMVRKAVARKIGELATVIEKEHVLSDLIQNVKQLIADEQDNVRVLGLNSLKLVAKILNKDENKQLTLPIIIGATEDKSWRVRHQLAQIFAELAEAFGKVDDVSLIQIFTNLLRDAENEVRTASIESLAKFIKIVSPERLVIIVPHLQYLARDSVPAVRVGVTEVFGIMSSLVPKDTANQKLLPQILEMFNDDNKDVRQGVTRACAKFVEAVGPESINNFVPCIKKIIEDEKWRVRLEAYDALVELARHFHNPEFFNTKIEPLYMNFMKDKTSAVRENGVEKLHHLIQTYKNEWVFQKLLPKLFEGLDKQLGYLFRITALQALRQVALNISPEQAQEKIMPTLYKHLQDTVPNVRFTAIKILKDICLKFTNHVQIHNEIKQNVNSLVNDNDKDVKYFAQEVIQQI